MKFIILILTIGAISNAIALPGEGSESILFSNDSHAGNKEPKSTKNSQNAPYYARPTVNSIKLQNLINTEELNASAWDLFDLSKLSIPTYGHPTRVVGSPGHWATLDYINEELYKMKDYYDISSQYFSALIGEIVSFNLTYTNGEDVPTAVAFSLSPSVKRFRGKLIHIPNYGCNDADYRGFRLDSNQIALIERGDCSFGTKSAMAGKHGFRAAVIYDNDPDNDKGLRGTLGKPNENTVATIGVSYQAGSVLIAAIRKYGDYPLYFAMQSNIKEVVTKNIIADTRHGDPENIVALGAHTDSVTEGPGINDDGSGTISLLTVAKHLTEFQVNNKVRFAWWSAEEYGLLGSNYYANTLSPEENTKIRLFMDYDMMASPNAEFQVYDGNNVDHPIGCEELKNMYIKYYERYNLNYTLIPFDGRSDYVGFIQNNIPAGGVATGAEKINPKNGKPFDKCYHQICDDVSNLNMSAFLVNTKLIAHSVAHYANSLEGFPQRQGYDTSSAADSPELRFLYSGSRLIG